jgi:hypothetical protein
MRGAHHDIRSTRRRKKLCYKNLNKIACGYGYLLSTYGKLGGNKSLNATVQVPVRSRPPASDPGELKASRATEKPL